MSRPKNGFICLFVFLFCGMAEAKDIFEVKVNPSSSQTLKERYVAHFLVGNIVSPRDISGNAGDGGPRFAALKKHFNVLTAENAMKPMYIQPQKGNFTFETADALVNAVIKAGMKMHGHTLAWHQQSPEWINKEGISRDEAVENLIAHVKTVAGHFKGRVISWDVLNEAINDNPTDPNNWKQALRNTPWLRAIGPDYIEIAFKAAREADPAAMLYYNDYNLDNPAKTLAVYNMVKDINEKYALTPAQMLSSHRRPLIDGIGMQGHYRVRTNVDQVEASIKRFASLGLEVSITELDVQAGMNNNLTAEEALLQGVVYAQLFAVFKKYAATIKRVTIWGLDDGSSWRKETSPTLFDKALKEKPAYYAALDPEAFLEKNKDKLVFFKNTLRQADARYGTPKLDASDALWKTAPVIPIDQNLMAWQGSGGNARILWDEKNLYILIAVTKAELNKANPAPHEQDSVEIFLDEGNHKAGFYQNDDGQYRINFANEQSFNPPGIEKGFESRAFVSGSSYTVAVKIPFRTITPKENAVLGFDVQINGSSARGMRQSVTIWNDLSGNGWQDPSLFGLLRLVK
jgi:endo-1,4-beta-xylanase